VTKFSHEPDRSDPGQVLAERAMMALNREFIADEQVPRFVIVIETPPHGRIAIGSTADDDVDIHRLLTLGASAARVSMSDVDKRRARRYWEQSAADFLRRN
jgi:hypothetical protein